VRPKASRAGLVCRTDQYFQRHFGDEYFQSIIYTLILTTDPDQHEIEYL